MGRWIHERCLQASEADVGRMLASRFEGSQGVVFVLPPVQLLLLLQKTGRSAPASSVTSQGAAYSKAPPPCPKNSVEPASATQSSNSSTSCTLLLLLLCWWGWELDIGRSNFDSKLQASKAGRGGSLTGTDEGADCKSQLCQGLSWCQGRFCC